MINGKDITDEQLYVMIWWKGLIETNNETFLPLFFDKHRYLVLMGGGGSGKSIFAGRKVLERVTTEPNHRWLCVRKVGKTLRESCFEQLKGQALEYYPNQIQYIPKGKSSDMYMTFKNGSEILFAGLDDVEKLKSIYDITGIWIEEASEISEQDFNQLDIRLRTNFDYYLQIIMPFNPISITHWLKKRFFDNQDPRARTHKSTYKDNRFLSEEAKKTLEDFKDTDPYYYMVYCLGEWGVSGKTVFDGAKLSERLKQLPEPAMRGLFEYTEAADGVHITPREFVEDNNGPLLIIKKPSPGRPYVIGCDTAGEGSDYFAAQVLDNITGEQVAVLHHQYDEDTFAKQVYCIGKYYNEALVGIETNYSTYPVKILDIMGYRRQYVREIEDEFDGRLKHAYGFRTDKLTRPVIISELIRIVRDRTGLINDRDTVLEMLTFVRNEKLRPEAEPGAHDDLVMALAIAYYIRPQQTMKLEAPAEARFKWTQDMWEDYDRASQQEKAMLIEMWGHPE